MENIMKSNYPRLLQCSFQAFIKNCENNKLQKNN